MPTNGGGRAARPGAPPSSRDRSTTACGVVVVQLEVGIVAGRRDGGADLLDGHVRLHVAGEEEEQPPVGHGDHAHPPRAARSRDGTQLLVVLQDARQRTQLLANLAPVVGNALGRHPLDLRAPPLERGIAGDHERRVDRGIDQRDRLLATPPVLRIHLNVEAVVADERATAVGFVHDERAVGEHRGEWRPVDPRESDALVAHDERCLAHRPPMLTRGRKRRPSTRLGEVIG